MLYTPTLVSLKLWAKRFCPLQVGQPYKPPLSFFNALIPTASLTSVNTLILLHCWRNCSYNLLKPERKQHFTQNTIPYLVRLRKAGKCTFKACMHLHRVYYYCIKTQIYSVFRRYEGGCAAADLRTPLAGRWRGRSQVPNTAVSSESKATSRLLALREIVLK